jgi:hypothetical protein
VLLYPFHLTHAQAVVLGTTSSNIRQQLFVTKMLISQQLDKLCSSGKYASAAEAHSFFIFETKTIIFSN